MGRRSEPAAPRRGGWRVALLLGLLLIGGGLGSLRTEWVQRRLASVVERELERRFGLHVVLAGVRVDPLAATVALSGLAVRSEGPDGAVAAPFLTVQRLQLGLDWREGGPALGAVVIDGPSARLHFDAQGLVELRGLPALPESTDAPAERFPWSSLEIHGAIIEVEHPAGAARVEGLDLRPEPDNSGRLRLAVDAVELRRLGHLERVDALLIENIGLSPRVLDIPAFRIDSGAVHAGGHLRADLLGDVDAEVDLDVSLGALRQAISPTLSAEGELQLRARVSGPTSAPVLTGHVETVDLAVLTAAPASLAAAGGPTVPEEAPGVKRREIGALGTDFRFDGRALSVGPLDGQWAGGGLTLEGGLDLQSTGFFLSAGGRDISLQWALADVDVHPQSWVDMRTDVDLVVAGTLEPLRLVGTVDLRARKLVVGDGPVGARGTQPLLVVPEGGFFAELDVNDDGFRILARRFGTRRSEGTVDAWIHLQPGTPIDVQIDLHRLALDELQPLGGLGLQGDAKLRGALVGPAARLHLTGALEAEGFVLGGVPYADHLSARLDSPDISVLRFLDVAAERGPGQSRFGGHVLVDFSRPGVPLDILVRTEGGSLTDFTGMFIDIPGIHAKVDGGLSLRGPWDDFDGEADLQLSEIDLFGEGFPEGAARGRMVEGRFMLDELSLSRLDGLETVLARGSVGAGWATNIDLQTGGFRLERLQNLDGKELWGEVDFSGTVGGTLFSPLPRGRLAITKASIGRRKVEDSLARFESADGRLRYTAQLIGEDLLVNGDLSLDERGDWTVDAAMQAFPVHVFYPSAPDGSPVRAEIDGTVKGGGSLAGEKALTAELTAALTGVRLNWGGHALTNTSPWLLDWQRGAFRIEGVALQGGDTFVQFGGRGDRNGELALWGGGQVDLDLLRMVTPGLTRASGQAGVGLTVEGPAGLAVPKVRVTVSEASLLTAYFPQPFESVQAQISASPSGFVVEQAGGRLGGGAFSLGGQIAADAWAPTHFDLWADVRDARVRYLDFLPAVQGDAKLKFDGPVDDLLLSGDIGVRDMLFAERIDWEDWLLAFGVDRLAGATADTTGDYFGLNLNISADRTIRMRNNVGDLMASANLRFVGDTSNPGLSGDIRAVPGGRVYLKEREFEITRADLHFGDPFAYDPELDIALTTSVRARDDTYDIDYRVIGPYSDWSTDASSDPGLPPSDINSLLLFGMTSSEMERYGGAAGALAVEGGDLFASKLGIVERVGERIYGLEFIRPERIDLVSGVNERGSGTVSSDMRLLVEKDFDWGTLIFEQNLARNSDTYLGFEKRLARKLYTRGYWAREQVGRRLNIGGAYGAELNLRWELD